MHYALRSEVEIERVGDGGAIILPDGGVGMLNRSALFVVEGLVDGHGVREVTDALPQSFEDVPANALCEVLELIDALVSIGAHDVA